MQNTTLCYIEQDGQYLMLHRTKKVNDVNQDKWIGVGGKFEPAESPEDCLLREVKEETSLVLTQYAYRGLVTFVSDIFDTEYMHLFTADAFTGTLSDCDEGEFEWIPKESIKDLSIWEGDKIFLQLLQEDTAFFSLKLVYQGETLMQAVLNGIALP